MNTIKTRYLVPFFGLLLCICMTIINIPVVHADTDGTELTMAETETLIIQLGTQWSGVEFELRTDDGLYPGTVVVDDTGLLTMELGGSTTYTLSALTANNTIPEITAQVPATTGETPTDEPSAEQEAAANTETALEDNGESEGNDTDNTGTVLGIPILHLVIFVGGLALCIGCLIAMKVMGNRRIRRYEEPDDDYEDDQSPD